MTKILFVRILKDHIGAIARLVLQERITSVLVITLFPCLCVCLFVLEYWNISSNLAVHA